MTVDEFIALECRFWPKVNIADSCWLWTASTQPFGYGQFTHGRGVTLLTHRVSWELANGPIPRGLHVCHKCDVPACVNPEHLFLGTAKDNLRDMRLKGRNSWWGAEGHCRKGHAVIGPNRWVVPNGRNKGYAYCVTCRDERKRRFDAARKLKRMEASA